MVAQIKPPKKPNSNTSKLVAYMKQHPGKEFTAKELAQLTGLPEQTANNALTLQNICRNKNSGLFYYPDNVAAQGETVKDPENDLRQKIEKDIQQLKTQIAPVVKQIEYLEGLLNQ